ncbi:hypothetical protein BJV82DRAFT_583835 [Fennellomyces sp. T-0311]|nr:hypothetical protein BJV82DRAFT_583835 [Fennellomyces sp. T-0311]
MNFYPVGPTSPVYTVSSASGSDSVSDCIYQLESQTSASDILPSVASDVKVEPIPTIAPSLIDVSNGVPKYIPGYDLPVVKPEYAAGSVIERRFDPDFVPPPYYPAVDSFTVENTFFYDLNHEFAYQHQCIRVAQKNLDVARRLLAYRIAARLYPVLMAISAEDTRQHTIQSYIATHLHDTHVSQDARLLILINNYFNTMLREGLPSHLAATEIFI